MIERMDGIPTAVLRGLAINVRIVYGHSESNHIMIGQLHRTAEIVTYYPDADSVLIGLVDQDSKNQYPLSPIPSVYQTRSLLKIGTLCSTLCNVPNVRLNNSGCSLNGRKEYRPWSTVCH